MDRPEYLWSAEGLLSMIAILLAMALVELSWATSSRTGPISLLVAATVVVLVLGRLLFAETDDDAGEEGTPSGGEEGTTTGGEEGATSGDEPRGDGDPVTEPAGDG